MEANNDTETDDKMPTLVEKARNDADSSNDDSDSDNDKEDNDVYKYFSTNDRNKG